VSLPDPVAADLSDRVCVVTGASAGIGEQVALGLARLRARVVLACRNPEKGAAVRDAIAAETGNPDLELLQVDLASQASIRSFARELLACHPRIHVLVNNAGIWMQTRRQGPDGIELTWATNVLGYHLVTCLLLPALEAAAPARVVNVASLMARDLDLSDVELTRRGYSGTTAYAQSKQANRLWTWALSRRVRARGVTANAMHPGGVNTEIFRKAGGLTGAAATAWASVFGKTPAQGADTALWLAAAPEFTGVTGQFFVDRQERRCEFRNRSAEEAVWSLCQGMTAGVRTPPSPAGPAAPDPGARPSGSGA
jgi:NAD(P)-dependent dehydrogenase (short-subunit alcohol dehydrogenase family)